MLEEQETTAGLQDPQGLDQRGRTSVTEHNASDITTVSTDASSTGKASAEARFSRAGTEAPSSATTRRRNMCGSGSTASTSDTADG